MSRKQNSRERDIAQQLSVGYYTPSGEHDVDPTEDIQFLLNDNSRLRKAIEEHRDAINNARNRDAEGYVYGHIDKKLYNALGGTNG